MAINVNRSRGRSPNYKLDRGNAPVENGPFIGEVRNNIDPTRCGRLQVFIEEFCGNEKKDPVQWITVSYMSPFYGLTQKSGAEDGVGKYVGNQHSYGMWFTPPDIGTRVLCFFVNGDPNYGFYIGCIPEPGLTHMVPAIGSSSNYSTNVDILKKSSSLPVTEINNEDDEFRESPKFYEKPKKPADEYVSATLLKQGLIDDRKRGTISSSSQRESPSNVYGISTPGRPIYAGGFEDKDAKKNLEDKQVDPEKKKVVGRRGGHSFVMDDGDIKGNDQLIRIRTAKGHQIMFSDDGDCIHIIHSNGQSWIELGREGTVDVYAVNSINFRTDGQFNIHSEKSINMYAKEEINMVAKDLIHVESEKDIVVISHENTKAHIKEDFEITTDGQFQLKVEKDILQTASGNMSLTAERIDLNGGPVASITPPEELEKIKLPEVEWEEGEGWVVKEEKIETIVERVPTHEPYPGHNLAVEELVELAPGGSGGSGGESQTSAQLQSKIDAANDQRQPSNPIELNDFANQPNANKSIGPLNSNQVTATMAQKAKDVGQEFNQVSDKGVGQFGLKAQQLEEIGYIKPGASDFVDNGNLEDILQNPELWSGNNGINGLNDLLKSKNAQSKAVQSLYEKKYNELDNLDLVSGLPPESVGGLVRASADFGTDTVSKWADGSLPPGPISSEIDSIIKKSQYAISFANTKLPETMAKSIPKTGAKDQVITDGVDSTVDEILSDPRIPKIKY